jgi:hypothetical protein
MTWRKLGLVFRPDGAVPWRRSHASLPLPLHLGEGVYRVYFASRDGDNRSHVGWVVLDLAAPEQPLEVGAEPALGPGPLGHFDDHGVYPASIVRRDGRLLLYYAGWSPGARPPLFYASIGLAVSDDGGLTFERASREPVMSRSDHDPCLVTSPCVLHENGRWRMWYVSGFAWREEEGALRSYYDVKYAQSDDGVAWRRDGRVCIGLRDGERNVGRPCVIRDGSGYRMWFASDRGDGYRIGYAESADGLDWERADPGAGLEPGPEPWDSDAVAYPWAVEREGRRYLLYNGNRFGRDGFGLAVAETAR